ncbi:MAG: hypothetical protein OEU36_07355 [Gammaproteobacteria bacterium]|nr:hypothetical protein [Gammaproteobacteria bacterium]
MTSFTIDESQLERLSPDARRELLSILEEDFSKVLSDFAAVDWTPNRDESYPLTVDEARALIRHIPQSETETLRVFARNYDGEVGKADLKELLSANAHTDHRQLGDDISAITHSLRRITGNRDAWLINWRHEDWIWNEHDNTYEAGVYFISDPAVAALRKAFGMPS